MSPNVSHQVLNLSMSLRLPFSPFLPSTLPTCTGAQALEHTHLTSLLCSHALEYLILLPTTPLARPRLLVWGGCEVSVLGPSVSHARPSFSSPLYHSLYTTSRSLPLYHTSPLITIPRLVHFPTMIQTLFFLTCTGTCSRNMFEGWRLNYWRKPSSRFLRISLRYKTKNR